jgi:hypothetical protein
VSRGFTHAAEAEQCIIVMVNNQVLIIDVIVHLYITGSSREW